MEFFNVKVVKRANVYFDGKVTSRTVIFDSGEKKTLGFMLKGEYEFNTDTQELMEVIGGSMLVKIKGEEDFSLYKKGESFVIPSKSSFQLKVDEYVDYCCSYK